MKIIFVRHGHPDYKTGQLTDLGHLQAQAVAKRLATEGIRKIYASPLVRAVDTAVYTANEFGLGITILDCIEEIRWGSADGEPIEEKGHPWNTADRHTEAGRRLTDPNWAGKEPWCRNKILPELKRVTEGFDAFMAAHGYVREGEYYRVTHDACYAKTTAIFGHGGAFTAIFAHLMNIPFPLACRAFDLNFTCITVAKFDTEAGLFCTPRFDVIGDAHHIKGITTDNTFTS